VAVGAPPSLQAIGARVAERIDTLLAAEQLRWSEVDAALVEPYEALRRIIASGKRLRPAFCHWGWVAAGGDPDDPRVVDAGAALELLHMFALAHDDIMDDSARRHGVTCLHVDFAERHDDRGWRGEARRFGDGAAILIGDVAFVHADQLLRGAPPDALAVFDELRLEVNVGQFLDLVGTASRAAGVEQARTIAIYKSGKYTIERPLHLGAALGGHLDELAEPFTAYGVPLGQAFQLRDDLLGAFGDADALGKPVGDDLRTGKPTALFALARAAASVTSAELLDDRAGQPDLTDAEIAEIQRILVDTGARDQVERMVAALRDEALTALEGSSVDAKVKSELAALAAFVTDRDR
jgi:geranylgeranyl diphosphate synthase type I